MYHHPVVQAKWTRGKIPSWIFFPIVFREALYIPGNKLAGTGGRQGPSIKTEWETGCAEEELLQMT